MGIFDIFTDDNEEAARDAQVAGLRAGNTAAQGRLSTAEGKADSYYAQALAPWLTQVTQNQAGSKAYGDILGVNGAEAQKAAIEGFTKSPATEYLVKTGTENALRNSARTSGTTATGQTLIDLNNVAQGQALQNYNNYVNALAPYLQTSNQAAAGASGVSQNQAATAVDMGKTKAGYDFNTETGVGNANANFELSKNNSSANIWGAIMQAANLAASAFTGMPMGGGGGGPMNITPSWMPKSGGWGTGTGMPTGQIQ